MRCRISVLAIALPEGRQHASLPDDVRAFVDEQVRAGGYISPSDYTRDLMLHQEDIGTFRAIIQQGMDLGRAIPAEEVMAEPRAMIER